MLLSVLRRRTYPAGRKFVNSSLIGKIDKARRYSQEPERVRFQEFTASFQGDNDRYEVSWGQEGWHCSCDYFAHNELCCHTMALERMLARMMPSARRQPQVSLA
jgi:hypothetical protein